MRYDDFILPKSDETIPVHDEPAAVHETLHEVQKPVRHFVSLPDIYMESFKVLGTVYALHIRRRGVSRRDSAVDADRSHNEFMACMRPYIEKAKKRLHERACAVRGCTGVNGTGFSPPACDIYKPKK